MIGQSSASRDEIRRRASALHVGVVREPAGKVIDTFAAGRRVSRGSSCSVPLHRRYNCQRQFVELQREYPGESNEKTQHEEEKREPRGPPGLRHRDGRGHLRHGR